MKFKKESLCKYGNYINSVRHDLISMHMQISTPYINRSTQVRAILILRVKKQQLWILKH